MGDIEKDTAIILLNWNAYEDTFACLKSLENLTYDHFHVFLVDNDSQDDSFSKLKNDYESDSFLIPVTFIQSGGNIGFAGGNNVGIKEAYEKGYEYFWLLNNDTEVDSEALTPLVNYLKENKDVGIVGSKIYYYGTNKIWFAGGTDNLNTGKTVHIGMGEEDQGQYNENIEVGYITGCSLAFKRELIDSIGYMDEDYFLYYEETDWNVHARKQGWRVVYLFKSVVYHKVSQSMKTNNQYPAVFVDYYDIRNSYYFLKRNGNSTNAWLLIWYRIFKKIVKIFIKNYPDKKKRYLYIKKALLDAFTNSMGKHPDI